MNKKITGGILPLMAWRDFMLAAFGYGKPPAEIEIENPRSAPQIPLPKKRARIETLVREL
jgi:hypothetical protein